MSDTFLAVDGVPEASLDPEFQDGGEGDRVVVLDHGLLAVRDGKATFAPFSEVLTTTEYAGRGYELVPRRPPAPPWIEVRPEHIEGDSLSRFLSRLGSRQRERGYRDPIRQRRAGLDAEGLFVATVHERRDVAGALDVPARGTSQAGYPGLHLAQLASLCVIGVLFSLPLGILPFVAGSVVAVVVAQLLVIVGWILAVLSMPLIGWAWRRRVDARRKPPRLVSLTPDGCVLGLPKEVRAFVWADIERFEAHPKGLVVRGKRRTIARIEARLLGAPVPEIVAIAEAYASAAR